MLDYNHYWWHCSLNNSIVCWEHTCMECQWNPYYAGLSKHGLSCVYKCDKASTVLSVSSPPLHFLALLWHSEGEKFKGQRFTELRGHAFSTIVLLTLIVFPASHLPPLTPSSSRRLLPCVSLLCQLPQSLALLSRVKFNSAKKNPFQNWTVQTHSSINSLKRQWMHHCIQQLSNSQM